MWPKRNGGPRWNRLNLLVLLAIGGLILECGLHLRPTAHKVLLVVSIVGIYGLMGLWVKANTAALEAWDIEKHREPAHDLTKYVTQAPPTDTQARLREIRPFYRHETPHE